VTSKAASVAARDHVSGRDQLLRSVGLEPMVSDIVSRLIDESLPPSDATALDAGCGRRSLLASFRPRVRELVGLDVHEPARKPGWLDRFVRADVCTDGGAFPPETFDVVLSSFTVEHLADPPAAFRNLYRWLKPSGSVVLSTVNRSHPLVGAYLSLSPRLRHRLQRLVKYSEADAHPVVGAANRPDELRRALERAGFTDVELVMTSYLARAWNRRLPTFALGLLGDLAVHRVPSRRSTIVARARRPMPEATAQVEPAAAEGAA
jgi:2-polyprenyl-3-methyl-5-hydroxy-6-metoxy-1,4-benzoquinol methylase